MNYTRVNWSHLAEAAAGSGGNRGAGTSAKPLRPRALIVLHVLLCLSIGNILRAEDGSPSGTFTSATSTSEKRLEMERQAPLPYRVGPEDVISVSIWRSPDLDQEVTVRPDGKIALKLVGELFAQDMSIPMLKRYLTEKYRDFIPEAEVSVTLKEMNSFKVYILGNISKPGELKVKSRLTVLQALAIAGGFTPYADLKSIRIFREGKGGDQILTFNYKKVVKGLEGDIELKPGDRLVVP